VHVRPRNRTRPKKGNGRASMEWMAPDRCSSFPA
jgi:hypothetical protein